MDHQLKTQELAHRGKEMLAALVIKIAEVVVAAVQGAWDNLEPLAVMGLGAQPHLLQALPLLMLVVAVVAYFKVIRQVLAVLAAEGAVQPTALL
jgi:hypothetical protein